MERHTAIGQRICSGFYGTLKIEAAADTKITAVDVTDALQEPVLTGQEIVLRIQLKQAGGVPFGSPELAKIHTTVSYKPQSDSFPVADIPAAPVNFTLTDKANAIFEAKYHPATPDQIQHNLTFKFEIPGHLVPEPLTKSFWVKSEYRLHNLLRAYNDSALQCLDNLDKIAIETSRAGDYFASRRDEKMKEFYSKLISLELSLLSYNYSKQIGDFKNKTFTFFNMDSILKAEEGSDKAIKKLMKKTLGLSNNRLKSLSGALFVTLDGSAYAHLGGVILDEAHDFSMDAVLDKISEKLVLPLPFNTNFYPQWSEHFDAYRNAIETEGVNAIYTLDIIGNKRSI